MKSDESRPGPGGTREGLVRKPGFFSLGRRHMILPGIEPSPTGVWSASRPPPHPVLHRSCKTPSTAESKSFFLHACTRSFFRKSPVAPRTASCFGAYSDPTPRSVPTPTPRTATWWGVRDETSGVFRGTASGGLPDTAGEGEPTEGGRVTRCGGADLRLPTAPLVSTDLR